MSCHDPAPELCRWVDSAACTTRPDLPWITDAHLVSRTERQAMSAVCLACPVRSACADTAADTSAEGGFWAGQHRELTTTASTMAPVSVHGWEQSAFTWPIGGAA